MCKIMKLSDIKISQSFADTTPTESKMDECRKNYITLKGQDRYIVVNKENVLIDGYIMYLVLKENNVRDALIKISNKRRKHWRRIGEEDLYSPNYRTELTTYVYGKHLNSRNKKEYIWRIPKAWTEFDEKLKAGDTIMCAAKDRIVPIFVTRIERLGNCPVDIRVRRVARTEIRRDGEVIYGKGQIQQ